MRTLPAVALGAVVVASLATGCGREPEGRWVRADMMVLPEGVPADDLPDAGSRGASLAVELCAQCHGVPTPKRHSAEDWRPTLRRMFARMEHMASMDGMMGGRGMRGGRGDMPMGMHGVEAPSDEERAALVDYYTANALRPVGPEALPAGAGVELFRERCSRCHALPDPAQHEPGAWSGVVQRMRENMRAAGVAELSDEETAAIAAYLDRAARETNGSRRIHPRRE